MTPETERERRANQIVRNADLYGSDTDFRNMVDNTVYLSQEQKEKSQLAVDRHHNVTSPLAGREYGS